MKIRIVMRSGFYLEMKDWDEIEKLTNEIFKIGKRAKKIPGPRAAYAEKSSEGSKKAQ